MARYGRDFGTFTVGRRGFLSLAALGAVSGVIGTSSSCQQNDPQADPCPDGTQVTGVGGSEKKQFFADTAVSEVLCRNHYRTVYDLSGSWEIADLQTQRYDLAFPAGGPAEERIRLGPRNGASPSPNNVPFDNQQYIPFSTLLVVATFRANAEALARRGVVRREGPAGRERLVLSIREYLTMVRAGTRWRDLGGSDLGGSSNQVLIHTTDPHKSNSAVQFLALLSYVANDNRIVVDQSQVDAALDDVAPPFDLQGGGKPPSTEFLFEKYLTHGQGATPLAAVYESQFLSRQARGNDSLPKDWTMLYTDPPILSHHAVVPFTATGKKVADLLVNDKDLQAAAVRLGYRSRSQRQFVDYFNGRDIAVLEEAQDVINPPRYDIVTYLTGKIK